MDVDKDGLLTASDLVVRPKKLNIRMYTPFLAEKNPRDAIRFVLILSQLTMIHVTKGENYHFRSKRKVQWS